MQNARVPITTMKSLDKAGLNVTTAKDCLEISDLGQRPILITHIDTPETFQHISQWLRDQLSGTHILSYIPQGDASNLTTQNLSLSDLSDAVDLPLPCCIYVPGSCPSEVAAVGRLVEVVAQLRHPEQGCPWDLEQTPQTLIPYIIEEAYETVDAIRQGPASAIAEELGDLLLQVVLQAQIAREQQHFSLTEVAEGITQKLIRRHPHVFGDLTVNSVAEVHANWETIKATEKGLTPESQTALSHKLQRYARRLPPLMAGLKLSEKAAAAGFEWPDLEGVWAKFYEELAEFQEALLQNDLAEQEAELGDLFFTLVNIARWCQLDPASALHRTNQKLIDRIQAIETQLDKPLAEYSLTELESLWQGAKRHLKAQDERGGTAAVVEASPPKKHPDPVDKNP